MACLLGVLWLATIVSPSCCEENDPDPKSDRDLDPDKLVRPVGKM